VEKLGFHWSDTRILLNSQTHSDHVDGAAEVVRETHAKNMVMDGDVSVVETGARTDFLSPSPNIATYAPVHVDRVLHDGDTVSLGDVTLTAHKTAGHTRGCTTWTMRSHLPGGQTGTIRNIVKGPITVAKGVLGRSGSHPLRLVSTSYAGNNILDGMKKGCNSMTTVTGQQEEMILVPRNPSKTMLEEGWYEALGEDAAGVWRVMIMAWEKERQDCEKEEKT
jgi:hypothetical protein